jgi:hypothetical protein
VEGRGSHNKMYNGLQVYNFKNFLEFLQLN